METERHSGNSHRLSGVRRGLENLSDKIDILNTKFETLNLRVKPVTGNREIMYNPMDVKTQRLLELERRNELHSRKLKLLQKEIDHVQTENEMMMGQMSKRGSPYDHYMQNEPGDVYNDKIQDERMFKGIRDSASRQPKNDEPRPNEEINRDIASPKKREEDLTSNGKQLEDKYTRLDQTNAKGKSQVIDDEEEQWRRRAQIYSCYDTTAINPQNWKPKPKQNEFETHPYPGGFLIMRFDDEGYDVAKVALKMQQSICRYAGGYLMGIARKNRIFVYENAPSKVQNWSISRQQPYKDCLMTDHALAVFWFTRKEAAEYFFDNSHHNRFREPCFPTPNGHEAFYVPLLEAPTRELNTFFSLEFLDARKYDTGDLSQFEGEVREDMLRFFPNCRPMFVSSQTGRVILKPGNLISPYSKLYISRFESQRDVDRIWSSGMIAALRKKWNLTGPINAYAFTIDIAF